MNESTPISVQTARDVLQNAVVNLQSAEFDHASAVAAQRVGVVASLSHPNAAALNDLTRLVDDAARRVSVCKMTVDAAKDQLDVALRAESAQTQAALRSQALDLVDSAAVVAKEIDAAVGRIADLAADLEGRINSIRSVARSAKIEVYDALTELAPNVENVLIPALRSRRGLPSPFFSAGRTVNSLRAKIESAIHIPPDNTEAVAAAVRNAGRLDHGV